MGLIAKLKAIPFIKKILGNKVLLYTVVSIIGLALIIKVVSVVKASLYDRFMHERETLVSMYEQKIAVKNDEIQELQTQIDESKSIIKEQEHMMKLLKSKIPSLSVIKKNMAKSTMSDEGLYEQSIRVLGPHGLNELHILDKCN